MADNEDNDNIDDDLDFLDEDFDDFDDLDDFDAGDDLSDDLDINLEEGDDFDNSLSNDTLANLEQENPPPQPKSKSATKFNIPPVKNIAIAAGVVGAVVVGYSLFSGPSKPKTIAKKAPTTSEMTTKESSIAMHEAMKSLSKEKEKVSEDSISFDDVGKLFDDQKKLTKTTDSKKDNTKTSTSKANDDIGSLSDIEKELFGSTKQTDSDVPTEESLDDLNKQLDENQEDLEKLELGLTQVKENIKNYDNNIQAINNKVTELTNTVNQLTNQLSNVQKSIVDEDLDDDDIADTHKEQPLVYTGPEYVVHAVIPGQAWLKSKKGQIITVSEGESIGDYGTITVIDAANGIVVTSSGISFR